MFRHRLDSIPALLLLSLDRVQGAKVWRALSTKTLLRSPVNVPERRISVHVARDGGTRRTVASCRSALSGDSRNLAPCPVKTFNVYHVRRPASGETDDDRRVGNVLYRSLVLSVLGSSTSPVASQLVLSRYPVRVET